MRPQHWLLITQAPTVRLQARLATEPNKLGHERPPIMHPQEWTPSCHIYICIYIYIFFCFVYIYTHTHIYIYTHTRKIKGYVAEVCGNCLGLNSKNCVPRRICRLQHVRVRSMT